MSEHERDDLRQTDDETGIRLRIIADGDAESPLSDDESVLFAVYHRHRENPAEKTLPTPESAMEFAKANAGDDSEWAVFGLYAYEHGAIMFRPSKGGNPFTCPFDSAQAGIIALKRADFAGDLYKIAEGICDSYTDWCNGNVWGYVVDGAPGVEDSCWGYVGDPEADGGAYSEGLAVFEAAVKERKAEMESEALARADEEARQARAEASRKARLDEVLDAARVFAEPNDTPAAQRLKEALEAYEGTA